MPKVSSAEVQRNFGAYREIAEGTRADPEAVTVLHYNKPSVVIVSAAPELTPDSGVRFEYIWADRAKT